MTPKSARREVDRRGDLSRGLFLTLTIFLALGLLAGTLVLLPVRAQAHDVPQDLLAKAIARGSVRVIVGLNADTQPEGDLASPQAALAQRQRIARVQRALEQRLAGTGATVVARYKYIPFMAFEVDADGLVALSYAPETTSFEEDVAVPANLASATSVIGAPMVWQNGFDGQGQTVAVLDTGVDKTHDFFTTGGAKVVSEACYSTNSVPNGSTSVCPGGVITSTAPGSGVNCSSGVAGCDHGTHVAGIAAGDDGNGPDFGVARGADVIAVQVFSEFANCSGVGLPSPCALTYTSDQIKGLERVYELRNDFSIAAANMSLGGGRFFDQATCDAANVSRKAAIDNLRSVGIATIIAAGNSGYRDAMGAPGCISTAISVGATEDDDDVASFSNTASYIDLLAPGVDLNSSVPGNTIASKNGTSMAAPMVAGAWAVARNISNNASIDAILATFRDTGTSVDDNRSGGTVTDMRRINLDSVLTALAPGLTVRKTASDVYVLPAHALTYTLRIANDTSTTADGVIITDTVPARLTLDAASLSADATATGSSSGSLITWTTGQNLSQGQALTRTFVVTADDIKSGAFIANTAYAFASTLPEVRQSTHQATLAGIAQCGFSEGFEGGSLSPFWSTDTTNDGRVRVTSTVAGFEPRSGSYHVILDDAISAGDYSVAAIILTADLAGQTDVELDFWWLENADEDDALDGVFISDDLGATWFPVLNFSGSPSSYTNATVDLDAGAVANGLELNGTFQIKFQFFDNYPFEGNDGYAIDDIQVICRAPDLSIAKDVTPQNVRPGQDITFTLTFSNRGAISASGVVITDSLPVSVTNTTVISVGPAITETSPNYTWDVADLAPGQWGIITITGVVSEPLAAGGFENRVEIGSSGPDGNPADTEDAVQVNVVNVAPDAKDDAGAGFSTDEDSAIITGDVLQNDADANGDALAVARLDASGTRGTVSLDGGGSFDYDPNGQFDDLGAGDQAFDTFAYAASDGTLTATATVSITIAGVNDAPTISDIPDQRTEIDVSVGPISVTVGDVDAPGGTLDALVLSGDSSYPALVPVANVTFGGSGALRNVTITPTAGMSGTVMLTVTVSDGALADSDTFRLFVGAIELYLPVVIKN